MLCMNVGVECKVTSLMITGMMWHYEMGYERNGSVDKLHRSFDWIVAESRQRLNSGKGKFLVGRCHQGFHSCKVLIGRGTCSKI